MEILKRNIKAYLLYKKGLKHERISDILSSPRSTITRAITEVRINILNKDADTLRLISEIEPQINQLKLT